MPDPLRLFISYRSSDAPKVDKIARDLALLRHDDGTHRYLPWQDKHNLPPAAPHWWDAIVDAIDAANVFVFHISVESLKSKVCQAELDYAHRCNLPIIPIVLEGEFLLNPVSGKYDLPKETWALVPEWLGERQFLFYTGADFFRQFEVAMDMFRNNMPRRLKAARPLNPDIGDTGSNHTRYAQAVDYVERLAFVDAEKLFDALVRRNDQKYGAVAADWIDIIRLYEELIEVAAQPRTRFQFKPLWDEYISLFPKPFWDGVFDPKGFGAIVASPSTIAKKGMTAEDYLERGISRPSYETELKIAEYTEAIRLNPQFAHAYYNRGNNYANLEEIDRAIADYTEAIHLNPQYANAYLNRGYSYHDGKQDYDRAIADYTEAIRLNPQLALAYLNRGNSYYEKEDYDRAIADYTEAMRLNPQYTKAYFNRGVSYYYKGEYDRAIADYTEAIRLNPHDASTYYNRGNSYAANREYDRAIADFTEAIRLNPQYTDAYNDRGDSHYFKGDNDQAIVDYEALLKIDPNYPYEDTFLKAAREAKRERDG